MPARKRSRSSSGAVGPERRPRPGVPDLLLVDAGMIAGWRRANPSLDQADEIIGLLRDQGTFEIVVLADAALKHELEESERDRFEKYRSSGQVVCAAAGTRGGHTGFMQAVAAAAVAADTRRGAGRRVLVLTARDLGPGDWLLARLARVNGSWVVNTAPGAA